jgi:hypothetical protein
MEPATKKAKSFRLRCKYALVTYAEFIVKENLASHLMSKCKAITFVRVAHEVGETGIEHTHAFIACMKKSADVKNPRLFDVPTEWVTVAERVHPNISPAITPDPETAGKRQFEYAAKSDTNVLDVGEAPKFNGAYIEEMFELIQSKTSYAAVMKDAEIMAFCATRMAWMKEVWATRPMQVHTVLDKDRGNFRPFQTAIYERLMQQDNRKVLWVVDPTGGHGKSQLLKWLVAHHGAFWCDGGKYADIAQAYDGQEIVCFDFKRSMKTETWCYKAVEAFKDGILFSSKYQSTIKSVPGTVRVVIMSNAFPDLAQLSQDRWDVVVINDDGSIAPQTDAEAGADAL